MPEVLPCIADRVGHRLAVLADSGIRRGSDVVKARLLGAEAVLLGRPVLHGLAAGGTEDAAQMIDILRDETDLNQVFIGALHIAGLPPPCLIRLTGRPAAAPPR